MDTYSQKKADLEHSRLLQTRITTAQLAAKIGSDATASPAAKKRADQQALKAQLAVLHRQLGEKLAAKAQELMETTPGLSLATAYAQAASYLGIS